MLRCPGDVETHIQGLDFVTFPFCVASDVACGHVNLICAPILMQNGSLREIKLFLMPVVLRRLTVISSLNFESCHLFTLSNQLVVKAITS